MGSIESAKMCRYRADLSPLWVWLLLLRRFIRGGSGLCRLRRGSGSQRGGESRHALAKNFAHIRKHISANHFQFLFRGFGHFCDELLGLLMEFGDGRKQPCVGCVFKALLVFLYGG